MSITTEQAEQMAAVFDRRGPTGGASINGVIYGTISTTIRSLAAERDTLKAEVKKLRATLNLAVTAHHEAVNTAISLVAERDTLRAALQWLLNDLQDYPASARPIAAYDNARAALGEKE
jgi:uncharacterized coiled-coil DUF342 family protein